MGDQGRKKGNVRSNPKKHIKGKKLKMGDYEKKRERLCLFVCLFVVEEKEEMKKKRRRREKGERKKESGGNRRMKGSALRLYR